MRRVLYLVGRGLRQRVAVKVILGRELLLRRARDSAPYRVQPVRPAHQVRHGGLRKDMLESSEPARNAPFRCGWPLTNSFDYHGEPDALFSSFASHDSAPRNPSTPFRNSARSSGLGANADFKRGYAHFCHVSSSGFSFAKAIRKFHVHALLP